MKTSKNLDRRAFLITSGKKGLMTCLSFIGISNDNKNSVSGNEERCTENITCHDCYKMGVCEKDLAFETRKDIKANYYKAKKSKGTNHG